MENRDVSTKWSRANAATLEWECTWFELVLEASLGLDCAEEGEEEPRLQNPYAVTPPDLRNDPSPYARTVRHYELGFAKRLILILALLPHLCPCLLDIFSINNKGIERSFAEFGGLNGVAHGGLLFTAESTSFF
ncbi:MAG: hypothetical protein D3924_01310 [Candidatus Electrothrix sp. AR4]|nr:hypothetical protein [Candidatus Electrothrix sp. AR4]